MNIPQRNGHDFLSFRQQLALQAYQQGDSTQNFPFVHGFQFE